MQRGRQQHPKAQRGPVELWAGPIQLQYEAHVRRPGELAPAAPALWLVDVRLRETKVAPWL